MALDLNVLASRTAMTSALSQSKLQKLAHLLRRQHFKLQRPYVVEFAGMPRTGKDTTIDWLHRELSTAGIELFVFAEGARICPFNKANHFAYTRWGAHRILNLLFEIERGVHRATKLVILNRGLFDVGAFLNLLLRQNEISKHQYRVLCDYLCLASPDRVVDHVFHFVAGPTTVLRRDAPAGDQGPRKILNLDTLTRLKGCYADRLNSPMWASKTTTIDSGQCSLERIAEKVSEMLQRVLLHSQPSSDVAYPQSAFEFDTTREPNAP